MISIKDLHVKIDQKKILKGINLEVNPGELHVIMGRNGTGKSTLANVIAGKPKYNVERGEIFYKGNSLLRMSPEDRARNGIFLSFQYPVALPGVNNTYFLKSALNAKRQYNGKKELDAIEFLKLVKEKAKELKFDEDKLNRQLNN